MRSPRISYLLPGRHRWPNLRWGTWPPFPVPSALCHLACHGAPTPVTLDEHSNTTSVFLLTYHHLCVSLTAPMADPKPDPALILQAEDPAAAPPRSWRRGPTAPPSSPSASAAFYQARPLRHLGEWTADPPPFRGCFANPCFISLSVLPGVMADVLLRDHSAGTR